jgi:hypothetical protein
VGVDTKSILISNPSAALIAQAIAEAYGQEPEIRLGVDDTHFVMSFPDTQDATQARQLHVFTQSSDSEDVFDGPATHCMLGMWGGSIEIMDMLARKFGGFVCDSDSVGDWRPVDRVEVADGELPPLSPEAVLNLALAKTIDVKAALEIRKLVKNREQFAALMAALDVYRTRTADAA